jgi:hypothetical protein
MLIFRALHKFVAPLSRIPAVIAWFATESSAIFIWHASCIAMAGPEGT